MSDRPHISVLLRQAQRRDVRRLRQRRAALAAAERSNEADEYVQRLREQVETDIADVRRRWRV